MRKAIPSLSLTASLAAFGATAVDDHKGHDHSGKAVSHAHDSRPVRGGVVTVVHDITYELVAKADRIELYVSDHGRPLDIKGATALFTVLSAGGISYHLSLAPIADRLAAQGIFKVGAGTRVSGQVTLVDERPATVRFKLK